ncbi:hypothetical protein [Mycolicibacterium baixiangningiae]|uniref:hypothetical protein n=1 Tax=Mycolicibacterium baixiangningiae TaxID=2761578 RepID=UPI0018691B43|nr:hypothetical protein [Mycolicibacterium baixiangningiae]
MHAHQLIHPWQLATTWSGAHRRSDVVVTVDPGTAAEPAPQEFITVDQVMLSTAAATQAPRARHWWTAHHVFTLPAPHTLPDNRSHYYPSRCVYLEGAAMSRMMDHL